MGILTIPEGWSTQNEVKNMFLDFCLMLFYLGILFFFGLIGLLFILISDCVCVCEHAHACICVVGGLCVSFSFFF